MKKSTTVITIIFICIIVAMVGVYAYLANRSIKPAKEAQMTPIQEALSRDLEYDYPASPKEVVKYYNDILKCLYNEDCSSDDIDSLGMKARELYDDELLEANETGSYLVSLHQDVSTYKDNKRRISYSAVAASTNVDYFEVDGFSFAKINCTYTIKEGNTPYPLNMIYLLRKDSDKRWKIYGWQDAELLSDEG